MVALGHRGCPRTALEVGRLLLSLNPGTDPLHVLLHLDYYALKAAAATPGPGQGGEDHGELPLEWLLATSKLQLPGHALGLYPNFAFARALAADRRRERLAHRDRRLEIVMLCTTGRRSLLENILGADLQPMVLS